MPRKKKATVETAVESIAQEPVAATADVRPEPEQPSSAAPTEKNRFRSWVTDDQSGYQRLTDEQNRLIVLKFSGKPEQDILTMLKEAGFRYQPEYFGQQRVWTRRNDFEGRVRAQEIETVVRGAGAEVMPS
jgi:hypothetical protein